MLQCVNPNKCYVQMPQLCTKARPFRDPNKQQLLNLSNQVVIENNRIKKLACERQITQVNIKHLLEDGLISPPQTKEETWPSVLEVITLSSIITGSAYGITQVWSISALAIAAITSGGVFFFNS